MPSLKKVSIYTALTLTVVVAVVIIFLSPIAKYAIEKYDVKYAGREITLDWCYVNPFTGAIYLNDVVVHEQNNDTVFFSANGLSLDLSLYKLWNNVIEISSLSINQPYGRFLQDSTSFNFSDLIEKFSSNDSVPSENPSKVNVLDISIKNGEFHYLENRIPINYFIKNFNFESAGTYWNVDTVFAKMSLEAGIGSGKLKVEGTYNLKTQDYAMVAKAQKFDLTLISQYMQDLTNFGQLQALVDADITSAGNAKDSRQSNTQGLIAVNDFHFGKTKKEDFVSFENFTLAIKELNPAKFIYDFDSICLTKPFAKFELYDSLDNFQTMFGQGGGNVQAVAANQDQFNLIIEIADYIKIMTANFFNSNYNVSKLAIYNGNLRFLDYSTSEKFEIGFQPFSFKADSIDRGKSRVKMHMNSGIYPYGRANINISVNPKDSSDFDLVYNFQKIPMASLNPYVVTQTSYLFDRGTLNFKGDWKVRNGVIKSKNHLTILDPRTFDRIKGKDKTWIPLPLILAFVRERGNVIDYEIPVTGNLNAPDFHFSDVILDFLKNIVIKPPTTPYGFQVNEVESEIEKSLVIKWKIRSSKLTKSQEKFIVEIADFLEKNPKATIEMTPEIYSEKENEYILLFEAKKAFFLSVNKLKPTNLTADQLKQIAEISSKDPAFNKFISQKANNPLLFTVQEKCAKFIQPALINKILLQLNTERKNEVLALFKNTNARKRVSIMESVSKLPFNGFSLFSINYKGEFPVSLVKAYEKINELNNESPRSKFKEQRTKTAI